MGRKEMRTKDQYKKIWYDALRKSKEFLKDIAEKFLIADNIDPLKFKENHDYYVMDRYGDHKPTPSCFNPIDNPMGFPYWFASAYPDIVKYYSLLEEIKLIEHFKNMHIELLENGQELFPVIYPPSTVMKNTKAMQKGLKYSPGSGILDKEGSFKIDILYTLKEYYKKTYPDKKLECQ
jgi:hypothetical protein